MNTNGNIQLSVGDLLYAIRKRWKAIVATTVVGLIIGIILSGVTYLQGTMTRNYNISASVVIVATGESGTFSENQSAYPLRNDFLMSEEMADTVKFILQSDDTLSQVVEDLGLIGITGRDIKNNLTVSQYNETPVLEFRLTWRSSDEGTLIVKQLLDISSNILRETLKTGTVSVVEQPVARYIMGGSLNVPVWGIMAILGLAFGIALSALDVMLRPTLIDLKDVQKDYQLETVGIIRRDDNYFQEELYKKREILSPVVQDYSASAYIVRNRTRLQEGARKILITSSVRGEGRTSVAINLALQLSEMEYKVLLVDFDTRNPEIGSRLLAAMDVGKSLNGLYRGEINEIEAINPVNGHLDVLPLILEHTPIPVDGAVIDLVKNLESQYDYVLFDTAPIEVTSDALSVAQIADAVILVIGFDQAQKVEISETIDRLDKSGAKLLGCIVNKEKSIESIDLFGRSNRKKQKNNANISELEFEVETGRRKKKKRKSADNADDQNAKPEQGKNILEEQTEENTVETISDEDAIEGLIKLGLERKEEGK